jgi:hypothetical protein
MTRSALLLLALVSTTFAQAFSDAPDYRNEIGGSLGWGHPYGVSVECRRFVVPSVAIGAGAGLSMSGFHYGADLRWLVLPDRMISPWAGVAYSVASGADKVNVNVNTDTATYDMKGGTQLTPRVGARFHYRHLAAYANLGYGIVTSGGGSQYRSGSTSSSVRTAAELGELGGLEISLSAAFLF